MIYWKYVVPLGQLNLCEINFHDFREKNVCAEFIPDSWKYVHMKIIQRMVKEYHISKMFKELVELCFDSQWCWIKPNKLFQIAMILRDSVFLIGICFSQYMSLPFFQNRLQNGKSVPAGLTQEKVKRMIKK